MLIASTAVQPLAMCCSSSWHEVTGRLIMYASSTRLKVSRTSAACSSQGRGLEWCSGLIRGVLDIFSLSQLV